MIQAASEADYNAASRESERALEALDHYLTSDAARKALLDYDAARLHTITLDTDRTLLAVARHFPGFDMAIRLVWEHVESTECECFTRKEKKSDGE